MNRHNLKNLGVIHFAKNDPKVIKDVIKNDSSLITSKFGTILEEANNKKNIKLSYIFMTILLLNNYFFNKIYYSNLGSIQKVILNDTNLQYWFSFEEKDIELIENLDLSIIYKYYYKNNSNNYIWSNLTDLSNQLFMKDSNSGTKEEQKDVFTEYSYGSIIGEDKPITSRKLQYIGFADSNREIEES